MKITKDDSILKWQTYLLGDHAIVFSLSSIMDEKIVAQIQSLNYFIQSKKIKGLIDFIPSYHTLTIVYDIIPLYQTLTAAFANSSIEQFGAQLLKEFLIISVQELTDPIEKKLITIPVCYDENFGIDLASIAAQKKMSTQEVIELHTQRVYSVYCLGFMPGFAYMGKVDEKIQTPRHEKPRAKVLAGSVGIAGAQTGLYPKDSPGGWQIIGRTPISLFDPIHLATLHVGDRVQFYAISMTEFLEIQNNK